MRHQILQLSFLLALLAVAILAPSLSASSGNFATDAFRKLQSLEGNWEGSTPQGEPVKSYISPIASNSAVMESVTVGRDEMVSLYSVDANSILLVHYSASNDQPRMRAVPASSSIQELVFSFENNPSASHEGKLVIEFQDSDHITERWTSRHDGKDTYMVFHLERVRFSRN
jgi:hypothetical protein